jgi:hypothetical protein
MPIHPLEPALGGSDPTALVRRLDATLQQPRHSVDIPGLLGVADGRLRLPVRHTPVGRTTQEPWDQVRLGSLQLGAEQLPKEMVVAVPLPIAIQRHQEHVGALQRLQGRRGPARLEDSVAEGARHPLENRRSGEEADLARRQVRQHLRPQVVGHQPVAPGKGCRAIGRRAPSPDRQRGKVQPRAPTLRVLDELSEVDARQVHPGRAKEPAGLSRVHAQVVRPDLQGQPTRPQHSHREPGITSRRQSQLRTRADVPAERGEGIEALPIMEHVQVVQDQDDRLFDRRQRRSQTRDDRSLDRNTRGGQRVEHGWVERRDPVERCRDVRQQNDRIVVLLVNGHPRERSPRP